MAPTQGPQAIIRQNHRFDPLRYTISAKTFLALLTDGKHIKDHFSDLYIGMAVFAARIKEPGWLKLHACLLTIPLSEDMKLRLVSYVVQFGQPFILPDGLAWSDSGYVFRGGNPTLGVSPLDTMEKITSHEFYDGWYRSLFLGDLTKIYYPPDTVEYDTLSCVQPRANFNNIVAYHAAHTSTSCVDGLCDPPLADDAVSVAYKSGNRPSYSVRSFWIAASRAAQTRAHATPTEASSQGTSSRATGKGKRKSAMIEVTDQATSKPQKVVPEVKLLHQRLPAELLARLSERNCRCNKGKKAPMAAWVQCDFCGRKEHVGCTEMEGKGDVIFGCIKCCEDEQVAALHGRRKDRAPGPLPSEEDSASNGDVRMAKRPKKDKKDKNKSSRNDTTTEENTGSSQLEGPASEIDASAVGHSGKGKEKASYPRVRLVTKKSTTPPPLLGDGGHDLISSPTPSAIGDALRPSPTPIPEGDTLRCPPTPCNLPTD